jgi:1-acyl-sn-glycerol-3-phosphate acyltransferase
MGFKKVRKHTKFNYLWIKWVFAWTRIKKYNVEAVNLDKIKGIEPPYIVMPNHMGFWDPFQINYYLPIGIHYVVSDAQFRNFLQRLFLSIVRSIPKTKMMSDLRTVKMMYDVIKLKGILGIFPEGKRSWDGTTLPVFYSVSRLVKKFRLPVITPVLKGAYLTMPRWTPNKNERIGKIIIDFNLGFTPEEIDRLTVDEIHAKLTKLIDHDEYEFQKKQMIPYKCERPAEFLELALFLCPQCNAIGKMKSEKDTFFCRACGYSIRYNEYGFFEKMTDRFFYENARDWNRWQLVKIKEIVEKAVTESSKDPIFKDRGVTLLKGYKMQKMIFLMAGDIALFYDKIVLFTSEGNKDIIFPIDEVLAINVQSNEEAEFYYNDDCYRMTFDEKVSGYKWMTAVLNAQEKRKELGMVAGKKA